jgi:glycosyltransferase involved in cell wall biosynthesis
MTIPVSIIMAFCDRPTFKNTLIGWSNLDYPDYEFIFIDDATGKILQYKQMIDEFGLTHKVKYLCFDPVRNLNIAWNEGYKIASGEFIIFAMQDEIISNKQILHHMINEYDGNRINLLPLHMTKEWTELIDTVDWKNNPELIETFPGFYSSREVINFTRTDATLLSHVTGQYRKDWDWFGLFRTHEDGYLWIDQDVAIREVCLGKHPKTAVGVKCYHQYHANHSVGVARNGYIYHTEREARLLDPAEVSQS